MRDPRFLPVEYHEPVDESEEDFFGSDEETLEGSIHSAKGSVKKLNLYIAS